MAHRRSLMDKASTVAPQRRRLYLAAGIGAFGAAIGLVKYLADAGAAPAGNPIAIDIGDLPVDALRMVAWSGYTVWVLRRGVEQLAALADREDELTDPRSEHSVQPAACRNRHRSLDPAIFVAIGQCTHQGCIPQLRFGPGAAREFLCPCHTSKYDLAGRVFRVGPAPANLVIPKYRFEGNARLVIGED